MPNRSERLSARGRSKRRILEPGVTAVRHSQCNRRSWQLRIQLVECSGTPHAGANGKFGTHRREPGRLRGQTRGLFGIVAFNRSDVFEITPRREATEGRRTIKSIGDVTGIDTLQNVIGKLTHLGGACGHGCSGNNGIRGQRASNARLKNTRHVTTLLANQISDEVDPPERTRKGVRTCHRPQFSKRIDSVIVGESHRAIACRIIGITDAGEKLPRTLVRHLCEHGRISGTLERRELVSRKKCGSVRAIGHTPFSRAGEQGACALTLVN